MELKILQQNYLDFLKEEGLEGVVAGNGDIHFVYKGNTFSILLNDYTPESDVKFFHIMLPLDMDELVEDLTDKGLNVLQEIINYINADSAIGKIISVDNHLIATVGAMLVDTDDYKVFFPKMMGTLIEILKTFLDMVEEQILKK
jgi:hypothetical protein